MRSTIPETGSMRQIGRFGRFGSFPKRIVRALV
jgi:hypothetical protein